MRSPKFGSLSSSLDPAKLSLTVKAIVATLLPVAKNLFGWELVNEETDKFIDAIFTLVVGIIAIIGYIRAKKIGNSSN